jgi:hypothetical protein
MKAITIWQPMAHAVVHLGKTTENRPAVAGWRTAVGDTVAIHAARPDAWNDTYADDIAAITDRRRLFPDGVTFSAIIGTARLTDVHWADTNSVIGDCCAPWGFAGHAHLNLDLARPLRDPIPCRGALGLWRVPDDVVRQLQAVGGR